LPISGESCASGETPSSGEHRENEVAEDDQAKFEGTRGGKQAFGLVMADQKGVAAVGAT
jgi:hypothetical protein